MHPALSAWLSARLLDRRGGHRGRVLACWRDAAAADRMDAALRAREADRRLAGLLRHARDQVPHFRDALRDAPPATPENARALLAACPPMTRALIQSSPARFVCPGIPARDDATGGSTGTPMRFRVDEETQRRREASLLWADSLTGWKPGDRLAMLWGADRDVQVAHRSWRGSLRLQIENRRWYNAFDMGPDRMAAYHAEMERFRPHLLVAYAGSLEVFARWLEERGRRPSYPLDAIVSSAEMLAPEVRARVERVFGRPVFDRYGNREAGAIAAECPSHGGLHVHESDFVVEVCSPRPSEEPGALLITYLHNRAMPLIRYDTGDLAVLAAPAPCACGRTTARIARIAGRQSDTIRTRAGRWIHGEYFTHLLYGVDAVRAFQFEQETLDDYCLRLAADPAACRDLEAGWLDRLRGEVGAEARVRIEYVSSIPPSASGKRKFTLSRVADPRTAGGG